MASCEQRRSGTPALRGDIQIGADARGDVGKRLLSRIEELDDRAVAIRIHAHEIGCQVELGVAGLGAEERGNETEVHDDCCAWPCLRTDECRTPPGARYRRTTQVFEGGIR